MKQIMAGLILLSAILLIPMGDMQAKTKTKQVLVAVIDTGYDTAAKSNKIAGIYDLTGSGSASDENGHGTETANVILEHTTAAVRIMAFKTAGADGRSSEEMICQGIRRAMRERADIIQIGMSAYRNVQKNSAGKLQQMIHKASEQGIFVVVPAGNFGEDTGNYLPAGCKAAIAVSAVNREGSRLESSNYGDDIDFCSYGSVSTTGIGKNRVMLNGTSAAAAIVTAVLADRLAECEGASKEEVYDKLKSQAKDLGEKGKDRFFGYGLLLPDFGNTISEAAAMPDAAAASRKSSETTADVEKLPELLTCDWKQISDEKLNQMVEESEDLVIRRFLEEKTEAEQKEIFLRCQILRNPYTEIVYDRNGEEVSRKTLKLCDHLYSTEIKDFIVQKKISGTYYMYIQNTVRKVYLNTSQDETKSTMSVKFSGTSTNPADNPTITVSGISAGAIDLTKMKVDGVKTFTDDSAHVNTIGQIGVTGITLKKNRHSVAVGMNSSLPLDGAHSGLWKGGYQSFGSNSCIDDQTTDCHLLVGIGDLELNKSEKGGKTQTYTIVFQSYGGEWEQWSDWTMTRAPTCMSKGEESRSKTKKCKKCHKEMDTKTENRETTALGHDWGIWKTAENNGIQNGIKWEECKRGCQEAGYQRNIQYLQQIWFRYMDRNKSYSADYVLKAEEYYVPGSMVLGYQETEQPQGVYQTAKADAYEAPAAAQCIRVDVPRKQYRIIFDGNQSSQGQMEPQEICCGAELPLHKNQFVRMGYDFAGWSDKKNEAVKYIDEQQISNLSYEHGKEIVLYAVWKPGIYQITLDAQGAGEKGTPCIYEKYAEGYFRDKAAAAGFSGGKIIVPQKTRRDDVLAAGERRQQFLGYYTEKDGGGHQVVKRNGLLTANIDSAGNYRYFTKDSVIYAQWRDFSAIQYADNLTQTERELLGSEGMVILPDIKWKAKDQNITIKFEDAVVTESPLAPVFRLKGWSLTPEISDEKELVLSQKQTSYTFRENEDVTLYAQWDTGFYVAYIGNGQSAGKDYLTYVDSAAATVLPASNLTAAGTYCFTRETKKTTIDILSGEETNAQGIAYTEWVPCSFQGWSFYRDKRKQETEPIFPCEREELNGGMLLRLAWESRALTFGETAAEYQSSYKRTEGMPFVNFYAVWDEYPQILASDVYVPLSDARQGRLTEKYLLDQASAADEELKNGGSRTGEMKQGKDEVRHTRFWIADYQASDFTGAEGDASLTITYRAEDAAGNVTDKMVTVYLTDTQARQHNGGCVRFISREHLDTLDEDSVWRSGEYARRLAKVLNNQKTGEEYTQVTPLQQNAGADIVKKTGSGTWESVQQVWIFTHEQLKQVHTYVDEHSMSDGPENFLRIFASCRIQK